MCLVNVKSISKSFGSKKVVKEVSFTIDKGHIYGFLGPNGAGKTTTIRMIMNIILPDSGTIQLFGEPLSEESKNRIGYLPEERGMYPKMKVLEHLVFLGELHGMNAKSAEKAALEWLEKMEMGSVKDNKVEELSKGMQQKIQFIATVLHNPDLIIMDEPFSGLDPVNVELLKDLLLMLKNQGKGIIFSTHMMDTAEKICDELILINHGQKVLDGNLNEVRKKFGKKVYRIEYQGDISAIKSNGLIKTVKDFGNYAEIELHSPEQDNDLLRLLVDNLKITRYELTYNSLHDIFLNIVKGDQA